MNSIINQEDPFGFHLMSLNELKIITGTLNNQLNINQEELISNQNKLQNIQKNIEVKIIENMILDRFKKYKLESKKDFILSTINTAIQDIFEDNIKIDIVQEIQGNNIKYHIVFYQNDIEIARNDDLLKSNGGGILQVISILFKILIGYLYSKNKFYVFDESFSQISSIYREKLSKFLRTFCEKYSFNILVVSHSNELDKFAHLIYSMNYNYNKDGIKTLYIESQEELFPDDLSVDKDKGYHLEIKNFQSIKELNIDIVGFTIIRGPNNVGKSAIIRSIESILYNSFNSKMYLRKGEKVCEIKFSDKKGNNVQLEFKSKKVRYLLGDEWYSGKSLAADKIKEYLEKLGFKYINMKDFYKNFKGSLKDQTERISVSTQYDSLFLIGSKANDSEKIFNFLFGTESITQLINTNKEIISGLNKDSNLIQENINEIQRNIDELQKKVNIIRLWLQIKLCSEYLGNIEKINSLKEKLSEDNKSLGCLETVLEDYSSIVNKINEVFNFIKLVKNKDSFSNELKILHEKLNSIEKYYNDYVIKTEDINSVILFLSEDNKLKKLSDELNSIKEIVNSSEKDREKILDNYNKVVNDINYLKEIVISVSTNEETKSNIKEQISLFKFKLDQLEIDLKVKGFDVCDKCLGNGLIHIKEDK